MIHITIPAWVLWCLVPVCAVMIWRLQVRINRLQKEWEDSEE